ncbi:hypothetical protein Y032_0540g3165 [Ancylostoma ceylanicum]|uniref:Uncharacterized protein n=1 Tax=Ancylostoma ceylanicum TaxID=53326 RepID=A0A016WT49_9BILA|nr:hypothetical protein Y032_0540g3165 [Ancylostoma ceylanicum]
MYPSNSPQSPPGSRLQKSTDSMDPSCLDRWHAAHPGIHLSVSPSPPSTKGASGRPHYWRQELGPYDSNAHRAVGLPRGEDPPTQDKSDIHSENCLLCCFCDPRGMLYYELLPQGHTVTGAIYANQLQKLAEAVRERRPRRACSTITLGRM